MPSTPNASLRAALLMATLFATGQAGQIACAQSASAPQMAQFSIPAGDLATALKVFGEQSNTDVLFDPQLAASKHTAGLNGRFATEEGLQKLLSEANLKFRIVDGKTVLVESPDQASATAPVMRIAQADAASGSAAPAARAEESSQSAAGSRASRSEVQEVVVTAQKKQERLQDVPVPVTAIGAEGLLNSDQLRLQDYYNKIPALNFTMGNRGEPMLAIRGVTTGPYGNPTVGIVVDDVPYGASTGNGGGFLPPDIDPNDLARVEVLRGPQGTLYGASSMGGLFKFVTLDPSTAGVSGRVQGSLNSVRNGDEPGYTLRGSVNVPLGETLAVRASAFGRRDAGYIDDPARGVEGVNNGKATGGRLAAKWFPTDDVTLRVSAIIQSIDTRGASDVNLLPGLGDLQQRVLAGTGDFEKDIRLYSASLTAALPVGELTVLSGYNDSSWDSNLDYTPLFGGSAASSFGVPGASLRESNEVTKFTQEVRLAMPMGPKLDWLVGAFYTDEKTDWLQDAYAVDPSTGSVRGAVMNYSFGPTRYSEYAAFTNLTFHFTERFDVQVGARESRNRQSHDEAGSGPIFGDALLHVSPTIRTKASAFTYLITPQYRFSPDVMAYLRLASGYRAGGPNQLTVIGLPESVAPDKTQNYELGLKADLLDNALSVDASLYYIDWKDMQLFVTDPASNFQYNTNASRARSQGVELSVESRPAEGMTISAWTAWNDAELTEDFPAGAAYGVSGDRLPNSSRLSGSLSFEQRLTLTDDLTGSFGAAVRYVGDRRGQFMPTPVRQDFPSYVQADLRVGLEYGSWSSSLFINNVTDRRGVLSGGLGTVNPTAFHYIQPRTAGLTISRDF